MDEAGAASPDPFTLFTRLSSRVSGAPGGHSAAVDGDRPPLAVGSVINSRYEILRALGSGGMGWVYDVRDAVHPERATALKILAGAARFAETSALLEDEFRTMTKLEHPNIARVYDFEPIHGTRDCIITMERIDGVQINEAMGDGPDHRMVIDSVVQVCRALSYVHSRGIVHYDLKPSNILMQPDGTVRVIDFGIARDAGLTGTAYRGTPQYMAPEMLGPSEDADHRADLYSLGITLYELLTGALPHSARRPEAVVASAIINRVALPERVHVPDWLRDLVTRLCAPDPADRFRSANDVIEAINAGSDSVHELETAETRQSYVMTPAFSGRRFELASVIDFVQRRLAGESIEASLLIGGEAGVGKSRLMREARQKAQLRRIVFIESNCYGDNPTEYGPISDLLTQLVPLVEQLDSEDSVSRWLPELVRVAPGLARGRRVEALPRPVTAEDERARLLEAVSAFFVRAATVVPYVLYINDLQWAGWGPARMFAHLSERIRDDQTRGTMPPLALIGSYRSNESEGRPLGWMLQRIRKEDTAIELELTELDAPAVGEIIGSMLGIDRTPAPFLERIMQETRGNPFFVQELMRMLIEDGTVHLAAGRWATAGDLGDLVLPSGIVATFRRRFSLLEPVEQDVLRALSVQGRPMPIELLGALLGNARSVSAVTRRLADRGLIVRSEGSGRAYAMGHDRMRETIYGDLSEDARRDWHRRIGELLERPSTHEAAGDAPPLDQLAHHFWHASNGEKALAYAIPAGKRAMSQFANQAALEHFEHALALLAPADDRYWEIFEHRADMLVRLSEYERAQAAYEELLLAVGGRPLVEARIHGKLADIHMQSSRLEAAVEYGWRALEAYGEKRPRGRLGWAAATLGLFIAFVLERLGLHTPTRDPTNLEHRVAAYDKLFRAYFFFEPKRTFLCTLRLWKIAAEGPDFEATACAKSGVAMMIGLAGMRRWAYELFEEARKDADSAGSRWWAGTTEMRLGVVSRMAGLWNVERLDRAVEALRDAGDMFDLGAAVYHAADACYHAGRITEAYERVRAMNAATARIEPGAPPSVRGNRIVEALCSALRGQPDERLLEECYAEALAAKDVIGSALLLFDLGEVLVHYDRVEEGLERLERGYAVWKEERLLDNYSSSVLYRLPRAYLELPELSRVRERRLRRVHAKAMRRTRRAHLNWRSPVLVNEARIRERAAKTSDADEAFGASIDVARRQNAGLFVSMGLYEWGRALVSRGDASAAEERLDEALELADQGGNVWLADRCRALLGSTT